MFRSIFNIFLIFNLIYDISFHAIPFITTGRLAVIFLIISSINKIKLAIKEYNNFLLVMLFLLLLSLFQSLISSDNTQFSRLFYFILYSLVSSFLIAHRIKDLKKISWFLLIAISFQAFILIYAFFNPSIKLILNNYIVYGANFTVENLYRSFGLTSSSGAALSVTQGLGTGIGLYLLSLNKRFNWIVFILIFLCFFSTIFVGRTGLVLSLILLIVYIITSFNFKTFSFSLIILLIISYLGVGNIFKSNLESIQGFSTEYFFNWLSQITELDDNKTINALVNEQPIPELTLQTIFIGTGTISIDGNNTSGHDSGYIQTYYSLGLLATFLFYFSLILFMKNNFKSFNKKLLFIIILLVLALEAKEPFLFKYTEGFLILTILFSHKFYRNFNSI